MDLRINERFESACPQLTTDEYNKLEALILKDGVIYSPILIWENVIIDGHNRYDIAKNHGLIFDTKEITFESDDDAIAWIKESAIGRRNLNDYQKSKLVLDLEAYYKGKAKERQKTSTGGREPQLVPILAKAENPIHVREELAKKAGVSHGTIDKVKFIENNAPEEVKEQLTKGDISISRAFEDLKSEGQKSAPEIDILESSAKSLQNWVIKNNSNECLFEFIPDVTEIIKRIRDKKTSY